MFQGEDQKCFEEVEFDEAAAVSSCLQDADWGPRVAAGALSMNASVLRQGDFKCWDEAVSAVYVSHYFLR